MKLISAIMLIGSLHVTAHSVSQTITLSGRDVPLATLINAIEKQSGYLVVSTNEVLDAYRPVSVHAQEKPLLQFLDEVLKGQGLNYVIENKTIFLKKDKNQHSALTNAPPIDVKGKVVDENGDPVAGVAVQVKGSERVVFTNEVGEFMLTELEDKAVLLISGVNIEDVEVKVNGKKSLVAKAKLKINSLNEVVVNKGYYSEKQRLSTGNVSTVYAKDIEKQPVNNPLLALQGRVPGLFITQATGLPGSGVQVAIQGQNSIVRGNDPFYVIDGVPYTSQLLPNYGSVLGISSGGTSGNPFSFLNPADIENISVLKDADATAIYGSRGANGVILITTKKGKSGQTRVDVNMQTGWGEVPRKLDLLNTEQYLQMRHEAKANDGAPIYSTDYDINGLWYTTRYTDWQKELIGNTAHYTDVNVSVSGGNANTQVLVGAGYHKETTVFPGNLSDQKGSLHFNINNISTNQKFRLQLTGNYLEDNNRIISVDLTQFAIISAPNAPEIYNDDGTLNWMQDAAGISSWTNSLAFLSTKYKNKTKNLVGNVVTGYQLLPNLEIKSSFGYTNMQVDEIVTDPLISHRPEDRPFVNRRSNYSNSSISSWIVEPQVNYRIQFGSHRIEALIGSTIQQNFSNSLRLSGQGYNNDLVLEDIASAPTINVDGTVNATYKYNALFGKLGYNFFDKYLLNVTARRDGSSRFGPGNQFHNFGAAGIGWIFSKENFIQHALSFLSFGKFSGSYGTTGNDQIGDYQFFTAYSPGFGVGVPYQGVTGLLPLRLPNAFLQWEETKKLQLGLDLGLFNDRVVMSATYFRNQSGNQLLNYNLPVQTGFSSILKNLPATVRNSGWEFAFNSTIIRTKNFSWFSGFNITIPKNQLLEFPGIESTGYSSSYIVGKPITTAKFFQFAGVDPSTGVYQFLDHEGKLTAAPDFSTDRTVLMNTSPVLYGGWQNNFRYKTFELDFLFQFVKRKGQNYSFGNTNGAVANVNQPIFVLDRWQKPGDVKPVQRYNSDYTVVFPNILASQFSNAAFTDASFARLKNLSLSWKMPESWYAKLKLKNARLYIQAQNLVAITNYRGLDPETLSSTTLPPLRVITIGLQVGL